MIQVRHEKSAAQPALIYVVGFMGAGKTSVGLRLAELLGWRFVDLDQEIERNAGESIRAIFKARGEAWFRAAERAELEKASRLVNAVVALGGGAFCSEENRRIVDATGISVWLDVTIETIYDRCAGDATRPLFGSLSEMDLLLKKRRPFYEKSRRRVSADNLSVDEIAQKILRLFAASHAK